MGWVADVSLERAKGLAEMARRAPKEVSHWVPTGLYIRQQVFPWSGPKACPKLPEGPPRRCCIGCPQGFISGSGCFPGVGQRPAQNGPKGPQGGVALGAHRALYRVAGVSLEWAKGLPIMTSRAAKEVSHWVAHKALCLLAGFSFLLSGPKACSNRLKCLLHSVLRLNDRYWGAGRNNFPGNAGHPG